MEKPFTPFTSEPKLGVNLIEAAKELQWQIDEAYEDPLLQQRAIEEALAILETGRELLGGHKVILHTHEAYALNPPGSYLALDRPEVKVGEVWLQGNYVGFAHFEAIGSIILNSLCVDVNEVKVLKEYTDAGIKTALGDGRSLVIPVQSVDSVMAA